MIPLLLLSIVTASLGGVTMHRARLGDAGDVFAFNTLTAAVWCVLLFIANGFTLRFTREVIIFGIIYGATQTLFILFKTLAMNSGPVSVTTLVGNFSVVVSVACCFILWREPVAIGDVSGLVLLMCGIILTTYKRPEGEMKRIWKVAAPLFLICGAGVGLTFKAFGRAGASEYAGDMMLLAALIMLISYSSIYLALPKKRAITEVAGDGAFLLLALASGALSCVYNRLNVYLSGALDGVVFFPSFNGGVVILSTLLGVFLLREKLSRRQLAGIAAGVLGITVIGIF